MMQPFKSSNTGEYDPQHNLILQELSDVIDIM